MKHYELKLEIEKKKKKNDERKKFEVEGIIMILQVAGLWQSTQGIR